MQLFVYFLYAIVTAVMYGMFSFFIVYQRLAVESVMYAYLWHIGFIIIFLILDKVANSILLSQEMVITERNYFFVWLTHQLSFISFKTVLYLFYTFILIVSRITLINPGMITPVLHGFVLSVEYCLILVVTFDKFIEHLAKDDDRIRRITVKFTKFERLFAYIQKKKKKYTKK